MHLPTIETNYNSITEFGPISDGKIKLDYKIFDHTWIESDGWDETNKYANVNLQEDTDISGNVNIEFTLTGANIQIDGSGNGYENFYIYWKATDSAKNISYEVQEVKIIDNTAPIITVHDVSGYAASDNNVTVFNVDLPQVTDNISIGLGDGSGGTIRLEYKIFNNNWIEEHGWDPSGNMYASVGTNQSSGENIIYPFNVDFTLSAVNIAAIGSNYENFYIYWKATDSANNISYEVQEVRIIDNTLPILTVYDVSGIVAGNSNTKELSITLPVLTDNLSNEFGPIIDGKIKLDYKIFNHTWIEENGWDPSGNMYANVGTNQSSGENITLPFNVEFTLTGANMQIDGSGSGYEKFYVYWKATDSAGNEGFKAQLVKIIDDTPPTFDSIGTIYEYTYDTNNTEITLPMLDVSDNVGVKYLRYKLPTENAYIPKNNWNDASVTAEIILYFQLTRSNIKIDSSGNGYEDFDIEWQIEDYGGNTTNYTQTIIIFDNSYPSVIDPVPAAGINISPIEEFAANNNNTPITLPRLVARDNIAIKFLQYKTDISGNYQNWYNWDDASGNQGDDDITLYYSLTGSDLTIPTSGSGYEEFFIYWKIEDYANNITEHIQTIIITDNIGPEISDITTDVSGANQNEEKSVEMRVDVPKVTDNVVEF